MKYFILQVEFIYLGILNLSIPLLIFNGKLFKLYLKTKIHHLHYHINDLKTLLLLHEPII